MYADEPIRDEAVQVVRDHPALLDIMLPGFQAYVEDLFAP